MYKLIAFDLDGTVADTLADLAASVNAALARSGMPTYPCEDYRRFVGNGIDNLMKNVLKDRWTPALGERVKADFSAYYADHSLDYTTDYPGMAQLLARLRADGYLTAVISNKPDAFVPAILGALYPDHRFTYLSGQQSDIPRKPAPDALLRLMQRLGVSRGEVLYVGDSDVDVRFAHNAGVKVCGVDWGFRGADELRASGADYIVCSTEELADVIYDTES